MMNNTPMNPMQVIQMLQKGVNPNAIANRLIQSFPIFRQAAQFMNGKTPQQIQNEANQMAQRRGVDLNQIAQSMGFRLPK